MSAFPITRIPTLASYVSLLRTVGAPVDAGLRRARLPTLFEEIPDAWISYERLRYFTADMATREGIPELGLIPSTADLNRGLCKAFLEPVLSAPTLFRALQEIPSLTSRQTSNIRFWLEPARDQLRACLLLPLPVEVPGYAIGETRTLGLIRNIIRAFVGHDFVPTRVLLASRPSDLHFGLESAYPGIHVRTGQPYGALEFPRALLGSTRMSAGPRPAGAWDYPCADQPPATLSETLEACLPAYLLEGYPHATLAAEIAGCSMRTLQRRLAKEGNTYGRIIDQVRCRVAISQLQDGEVKLDQLSQQLGYSEQSAFTRAFRRWTGIPPSEYRAGLSILS
jgi:AraC-like DNA-binding protein